MRKAWRSMALAVALGGLPAAAAEAAEVFDPRPHSEPRYAMPPAPEPNVVHAGDGSRIYTETYLPQRTAEATPPRRLPTVLAMTPYETAVSALDRSASAALRLDLEHFVRRGYAFTVGHVYGTGRSEGCLDLYGPREVDATARVIRFVGERAPWASGAVGMYGLSYPGETQIAVATLGDRSLTRSLKAIVPVAAATGFYDSYVGFDGVPFVAGDTQNYLFYDLLTNPPAGQPPPLARAVCAATQLAASGRRSGDFTSYDREREFRRGARRMRTPTLLARGLLDTAVHPIADSGFLDRLPRRTPAHAIVGQWGHVFPDTGGRTDWLDTVTAWFDHWLKRRPTGVRRWPRVQVEDTQGRWRAERSWPRVRGRHRRLRLGAADSLGGDARPGEQEFSDTTTVHTPGAPTFVTEPLPRPLHLTGQPFADLWLRTDNGDGHVGLLLETIDGEGRPVSGAQLAGMRSLQHLDPLVDGRFEQASARPAPVGVPVRVRVRLVPLDVTVPAGGRLRLTIAGVTDWDLSGVRQVGAPSGSGARLTLMYDEEHPSSLRITLPRRRAVALELED